MEGRPLDSIRYRDVEKFLVKQQGSDNSGVTMSGYYDLIVEFSTWAITNDYLAKSPVDRRRNVIAYWRAPR